MATSLRLAGHSSRCTPVWGGASVGDAACVWRASCRQSQLAVRLSWLRVFALKPYASMKHPTPILQTPHRGLIPQTPDQDRRWILQTPDQDDDESRVGLCSHIHRDTDCVGGRRPQCTDNSASEDAQGFAQCAGNVSGSLRLRQQIARRRLFPRLAHKRPCRLQTMHLRSYDQEDAFALRVWAA